MIRKRSNPDIWRPEGREIVVSSQLFEIDELMGSVEVTSELEDQPSELDIMLYNLSGKIAVTGYIEQSDCDKVTELMNQQEVPIDTPEVRINVPVGSE